MKSLQNLEDTYDVQGDDDEFERPDDLFIMEGSESRDRSQGYDHDGEKGCQDVSWQKGARKQSLPAAA